ncbi:MAG: DEAD/DEAH box helicase family protein [Thermoleophilaceae bacterium]
MDIPIHAFDLIVADECHRGYSAKDQAIWRETLDYFDAIKIGLTATPAAHTMAYFENLAYRYDYASARMSRPSWNFVTAVPVCWSGGDERSGLLVGRGRSG